MWQTLLAIFYMLWLCAALGFLYLIWHDGKMRAQKMTQMLIDAAMKSAEAAHLAAEAANHTASALAQQKQEREKE